MATYNKGCRNTVSIQSILDQTYEDFKYIIVNDGSPDNTKDILDGFHDPRLRVIHQQNKGFTKTMISIMKEIETPYVAIQGTGDISLINRLETQINFLEAKPNVGVVSSIVRQVPASRENSAQKVKLKPLNQPLGQIDFLEYSQIEQMLRSNIVNHGKAMLRMDACHSAGGYRSFFHYAQDRDLWQRILEKFSAVRLNLELYLKTVDSEFDIFSNPRKVEKQILFSLFVRRLAYNKLKSGKTVSDGE